MLFTQPPLRHGVSDGGGSLCEKIGSRLRAANLLQRDLLFLVKAGGTRGADRHNSIQNN
jgi:hypothetical protein